MWDKHRVQEGLGLRVLGCPLPFSLLCCHECLVTSSLSLSVSLQDLTSTPNH